jgi:superfamily I DNA and/or RNA helicase/transcription elongation GreA/GreB family factor/very-short-patch-repair endonuclease
MVLTKKFLTELQKRLKMGNRRGVHLNAIPANSRYKFDLSKLAHIDKNIANNFITALLAEKQLKFRISWKDNIKDLNLIVEEDQSQLVKIAKTFENLINQTEEIESEKGINTFGFGFPILVRKNKTDNKLTVAPILIWSLRIKRSKEFNTWEILRNEEDSIYINEVLINHLQSDSNIKIEQIPSEMLEDGLIDKNKLIDICTKLVRTINLNTPVDLEEIFKSKLEKVVSIKEKAHYEKLPMNSTNSFIEFGGLFSIFEVQKQNIIHDYEDLINLEGIEIPNNDIEEFTFQSISSIETDPSQQGILNSLKDTRNILIQGPPGTGKSQTLTAILINALENNKKTIVVCEKRTALEVLHKALIEKGLNQHCVLIRDIIKDRRIVVESVRERTDKYSKSIYRFNASKIDLENIIDKATKLISSINNMHQKLGKELIQKNIISDIDQQKIGMSKNVNSWTYVVGKLLSVLRVNIESSNLNIDRHLFKYSAVEYENLLKLVEEGQSKYKKYLLIELTAFINPLKFNEDNYYTIEQTLKKDFDSYLKQIQEIKILLEKNRIEYKSLRTSELNTQIISIDNCFEKIFAKKNELSSLVLTAKNDFCQFRNIEFAKQKEIIINILNQIDVILNNNINNPDLLNSEKINRFSYKFLSIFSKSKKQTITDNSNLILCFKNLQEILISSKDFNSIIFDGSIEDKKNSIPLIKTKLTNLENNLLDVIEKEFSLFNLDKVFELNSNNSNNILLPKNDPNLSIEFRSIIESILTIFSNYISELNLLFQNLSKGLLESADVKLNYTFEKSYNQNFNILSEIKTKINLIKKEFDSKIELDFNQINLLKLNKNYLGINSLPILQEKVNNLANKIIIDDWTSNKIETLETHQFITAVENLINNKNRYINAEEDYLKIEYDWWKFYNCLSEFEMTIINELKLKSSWKNSFLLFYFNSVLENAANMDLPTNDEEHKELKKTLNLVEKEQLKFIKEFWYKKQEDSVLKFEIENPSISVENLYIKRSSRLFKRLSLLQIVKRDKNLFTNFFPIILTSPDVACNLFKGMNNYFDIVMFDEASQLRLEDNLPAILKGKQIVIAGDEHQMPPSNYFSKVFDGAIEDEEDLDDEEEADKYKEGILLSCESLLDFATELKFSKQFLDFHYRSRHPYLIDFSNFAFYKQRLMPLPNDFEYIPINYIQVNGTFSDHKNEAEAEMVLSILEKNIQRLPNGEYPTLGIATFNIAQRDLIKNKIVERQKFSKFSTFNTKIQELEENGMFIKNLENIQGDERDIIILSTTYGAGKDGKFAQRFGPINHLKGYKLLNVIITRAKYKVYCCTSIPENEFMKYNEYLSTEGNNKKAIFYTYLAYCKAISERNNELRLTVLKLLSNNHTIEKQVNNYDEVESPFEQEVYNVLKEHFDTSNLKLQYEFAGFRIDIVYDSQKIGVPKVAIECDGAKYHSSNEAYVYDRHRQKILESHGFVFHRIWSTNWWTNPNRETNKLVNFINEIESTIKNNIIDYSKIANAFTDNLDLMNEHTPNISYFDNKKERLNTQLIEDVVYNKTNVTILNVVKLQSKVNVKYLNNGNQLNVHIVDTENNALTTNGIQKIYKKSPLAISLLGHEVGEIVKIGKLDNYVEIIKIEN